MNHSLHNAIVNFIWVLTNRKVDARKGKVQLVDASAWYQPLRKNMGKKNCELSEQHIQDICNLIVLPAETKQSKIFPNEEFGYYKVIVERPLRLRCQFTKKLISELRFASGESEARKALFFEFGELVYTGFGKRTSEVKEWLHSEDEKGDKQLKFGLTAKKLEKLLKTKSWQDDKKLMDLANAAFPAVGDTIYNDYNTFVEKIATALKKQKVKATAGDIKKVARAMSVVDENAEPVIKNIHKAGKVEPDPLHGSYEKTVNSKSVVVEYEADTALRVSEQVPLLEEGGIPAFIEREVLPYTSDAWVDASKTKIGYEISFTKHFYKPAPAHTGRNQSRYPGFGAGGRRIVGGYCGRGMLDE